MLSILKYPDPRLHEISKPVTQFNDELRELLDEMAVAMYAANGVGLAAIQVGRPMRLFVIDITWADDEGDKKLYEIINPKLHDGTGKILFEEGCLSVPGVTEEVSRKKQITVDYQDRFGNPQSLVAEGLFAVALQHENDHLDGILFVDRLSPLKRRFVKKKLDKAVTL